MSSAAASPATPAEELARTQARLTAVTARAQQLADDLERSRALDGGLRRAVEDLQVEHDAAQDRLDARVREVYITAGPRALDGWHDLLDPGRVAVALRGQAAGVRVGQDLVDAVTARGAQARAVREGAAAFREGLRAQVATVLADQDEARALLARAEELVREEQSQLRAEQFQLRAEQSQQLAAQEQQRQEAARAALDAVSASVTRSLTPATTERGRRATAAAGPLLALLEAAGAGYPTGWAPTGEVVAGTASWYGPGFVGSPTASGRPYDPEQLTCAHKTLPLGTVLHVTANGRSTNCLVDDRGPYVGDRVLDLSRAGSRALGYDGTAEVVAEVLRPSG